MAVRKKILVVAGNLSHLDQFVIHGFFKELSESANVYLTLPEEDLATERWAEVAKVLDDSITGVIPYKYSARAKKAGYQLGAALTYRHRKASSGYRGRISNSLLGNLDIPIRVASVGGIWSLLKKWRPILKNVLHQTPAIFRGSRIFFWIWSFISVRRIVRECEIGSVLRAVSPDASITLMQRQAGFVVASLASGESEGVPTLLIPYKWDNASSKSPLIQTPNKILVYNLGIRETCSKLHKVDIGSVVAVGSVEVSNRSSISDINQDPHVSLIGASSNASESKCWLEVCNSVVRTINEKSGKPRHRLVWRPYPTADAENLKFMRSFVSSHENIELDQDIADGKSHRSGSVSFGEARLSYFRFLNMLNSASVVVSEGTSAIVDARARGVPVIYPAFKRDSAIGSQWFHLNRSEHLKGLRETTGVFIAEDEQELEDLLINFLTKPRRIPADNSGQSIFVDERSYAQRVLDVVDEVVAEKLAKAS